MQTIIAYVGNDFLYLGCQIFKLISFLKQFNCQRYIL